MTRYSNIKVFCFWKRNLVVFHCKTFEWIDIRSDRFPLVKNRIRILSLIRFHRKDSHWFVIVSAIDKQLNQSIARNYLLLSIVSVALFRSSSAFINNSFSMYTILFAYTCWFSNVLSVRKSNLCSSIEYHVRFQSAVFFIALGSLFGWIYVV